LGGAGNSEGRSERGRTGSEDAIVVVNGGLHRLWFVSGFWFDVVLICDSPAVSWF
jgi:hypothetical protein